MQLIQRITLFEKKSEFNLRKMGSSESKEQKLDNQGQVNTNVVIEEDVEFKNGQVLILLYIIVVILIIHLIYKIIIIVRKQAKKDALRNANSSV